MPAQSTRYALLLLLAAGLTACASDSERAESQAQRIYARARPPATPLEFVVTVKTIADADLCKREDFYTEPHLRKLFGEPATLAGTRYEDGTVRVDVRSFAAPDQPPPVFPTVAGISMEAQRELSGPTISCRLGLSAASPALDFASVVKALGPDWKEDKDAELQYLIAITRIYINPTLPPATGYMGNTVITYKAEHTALQLHFGPEGILRSGEMFELRPPRKRH
jgi:hypothetical protein